MNILLFSGSLRTESLNKKLVAVAAKIVSESSAHQATIIDLKTLAMPVYDGDIEATAFPAGVKQLGMAIQAADALIISSPEYNGAMAGSLKNTVDWISRLRPVPLEKKPVLLLGASPGGFGAIRALTTERGPFDNLGCFVFPQTFALAKANDAFSAAGDLSDAATRKRLSDLIANYLGYAQKLIAGN